MKQMKKLLALSLLVAASLFIGAEMSYSDASPPQLTEQVALDVVDQATVDFRMEVAEMPASQETVAEDISVIRPDAGYELPARLLSDERCTCMDPNNRIRDADRFT